MSVINLLLYLFFGVNIIATIIIVFKEPREISAIWAWLLVLLIFPGIGFVLYLFIGKKLSQENIFDLKRQKKLGLKPLHRQQQLQLYNNTLLERPDERRYPKAVSELISLFLMSDKAIYSNDNTVELITEGDKKFGRLLSDMEQAQHYIHVEYYIFENDSLGQRVMDILVEKARQGIEVLVLYDALGSRKASAHFFQQLKNVGGETVPFFGSDIPYINLRFNYRNHRKIVVIDGLVRYIGGFNVGDDYIGKGRLGEWRDTHLRVQGSAVHELQTRFLMDWNAVVGREKERAYKKEYFPLPETTGDSAMQIVTSGPDSEIDQIKQGFLKMIYSATESIHLQTPYLIFDESFYDALQVAAMSGVAVHIMIPNKPDHPFVYRATEYHAKTIQQFGAHIHIYQKGFLHAKTLVVDGQIASVGTANFDVRSFKLNFEVNAFIYDRQIAEQLVREFQQDLHHCIQADAHYFNKQSPWRKFKQSVSRLFSPIL